MSYAFSCQRSHRKWAARQGHRHTSQPCLEFDRRHSVVVEKPRQKQRMRSCGSETGFTGRRRNDARFAEPGQKPLIIDSARITEMDGFLRGDFADAVAIVFYLPQKQLAIQRRAMTMRMELNIDPAV